MVGQFSPWNRHSPSGLYKNARYSGTLFVFHGQVQLCQVLAVALAHQHIAQTLDVGGYQDHRTEQTGVRQMCTPVPAEHAVGLAQMDEAIHGVLRAPHR